MAESGSCAANWSEGLRRALPITLGYVTVGFAFGVLAVKNGIPPSLCIAMALLMFSGSGQFVFAALWGAGTNILSLAAAVGIVNLRYLLMSAAESPWMTRFSRFQRFLLGLGLTDETFAVHITALQAGSPPNLTVMFVCNCTTHIAWISGCAIGAYCGGLVNDVRPLGLDFAITAMFLALLVPQCSTKLHFLVAIFTLCLSVALKCAGMSQWNVALATIIGATIGLLCSLRKKPDHLTATENEIP